MIKQKNENKCDLSVVIPVYGCKEAIGELCTRLKSTLIKLKLHYEIILVDDCCPDDSWSVITAISDKEKHIVGIKLSRNFGQHHAITAGLDFSKGQWIVVMDCDLQDKPEEIINLYNKAIEGFDIVVGKRNNRKDNILKKLSSKLFYIVFNYLTNQKLDNTVANFGIYSRRVIEEIKKFKEKDRSFGLLAVLVGFKRTEINVVHGKRDKGKSSYNLNKRMNMAIDHILSHSVKPLMIGIKIGFIISIFSTIYIIKLVILYLLYGNKVDGWTSLSVSIFFLSGLIIAIVGIVGLYIGKIYDEVKNRPLYIIDEIK